MKKLKIAMFTDSFFPVWGGRERVIHECMSCHIKRHDARLFCPKIKGKIEGYEDKDLPYPVYRCNSLKVGKLEYLSIPNPKFKKEVKNFKPDIIHCQTKYGLMNYALKYGKKHNIPVVTSVHTIYPIIYQELKFKPLINFAIKRVLKILDKCDGVVAVSKFAKEILESNGVKNPIKVIKNGIEIKDYNFSKDTKKQVRQKYNIREDSFVIIFAGYLEQRKNIMFQLECLKLLKEKYDNFTFVLVGEGSQKEELQKYVKNNNLEANVIFTGYVSNQKELYSLYYASDLFFFASISDSDGLVVVEAALNKTPSLVLEKMASCERITNNINGFIEKNNSSDVANRLLSIINDKDNLEKVSLEAYKTIPKSWDEVSLEYEAFYEKVLDEFNNKKQNK